MKTFIFVILLLFLSDIISYKYGKQQMYQEMTTNRITFYATVVSVEEKSIFVKGLDMNEEQFEELFECIISDASNLHWKGIPRTKDNFKKGDIVSVTSHGNYYVQIGRDPEAESYTVLPHIEELKLLE